MVPFLVPREDQVIEFKPYVFLVDFKQWRLSLWDPIYWTRSESGLRIGGTLHSWEDQQQYDVAFLVDADATREVERRSGLEIEEGPLANTYQKREAGEGENRRRQVALMRLTDALWLACKYAAIDAIEKGGLHQGQGEESLFPVGPSALPWSGS